MLRLLFVAFIQFLSLSLISSLSRAQSEGWSQVEACAALPSAAPDTPFEGLLVFVADDAARGFRAGIDTTYVLSFAGGNFLSAGAVSPDGRYYAVPNGVINTVTSSDIRYVVREIRILTTDAVPRIVERIPWLASFPVGTPFTSDGDIPRIHWVSSDVLQFVSGTLSEGQLPVTLSLASGTQVNKAYGYDGYRGVSWSPDGSRFVTRLNGLLTLQSVAGDVNQVLTQTPRGAFQIAWSPDNTAFAMTDTAEGAVTLRLYDLMGAPLETIAMLPADQLLWNLRWSPDSKAIAFTAFDPQSIENRLHLVDLDARTVTDTCLPVVADVDGRTVSGIAWAPDGSEIALLTGQTSSAPQVQIYTPADRSRYALTPAAGRLIGWYP